MEPELPQPDPALLQQLAAILRDAASADAGRISAEWSQAGTQHSGRAYASADAQVHQIHFPDAATALFVALRKNMARPGIGTWLSARVELIADTAPEFSANYVHRPAWNSETSSMLDLPPYAPVPSQEQWLADLQRYPRERHQLPPWLGPAQIAGEEVSALRTALDGFGVPRAAVILPGEAAQDRFEGTLEVVRLSGSHYLLRVTDYGQHHLLGEFRTEREACLALWQYLAGAMPQRLQVTQAQLMQRAQAARPSFDALAMRLRNIGAGGMLTNLAVGVPYDRFGGLDGLYFFGWGTAWEQRSLPPTANAPGGAFVTLVALHPVEVQAEIVEPWFDQPGGGIRFHVEGGRALRDLVRQGYLAEVEVTG
ncbi:MAG: TNT domain-containing protein [Beutenbergiaceae bacterium]